MIRVNLIRPGARRRCMRPVPPNTWAQWAATWFLGGVFFALLVLAGLNHAMHRELAAAGRGIYAEHQASRSEILKLNDTIERR
jgi:hypothetical protein